MTHRSKRLRESAKVAPYCFGCGLENPNGDLLCLAHSNALADGRGVGHKSDDARGAILCARCHGDVDGLTGWDKDRKRAYHHEAHLRTLEWWKRGGYLMMEIKALWEQARKSNFNDHITEFARLVAEAEREACAVLCDEEATAPRNSWEEKSMSKNLSEYIRARASD